MTRIPAFDGVRAVAILMIVTCHVCYGAGAGTWGQFLGGTFNAVFFLLSAVLLGIVNKPETGGGVKPAPAASSSSAGCAWPQGSILFCWPARWSTCWRASTSRLKPSC